MTKGMIVAACALSALACAVGSFVFGLVSAAKLGISLAFALVTIRGEDANESVRANVRKWHGGLDDQFENIDNLVRILKAHDKWDKPVGMQAELEAYRDKLQLLMNKCKSSSGSPEDRLERNSQLKGVVAYCLTYVKFWAYHQLTEGGITKDDLHNMRFLLPAEAGGHHERGKDTKEFPNTKVKVLNMVAIEVIVDQADSENAAKIRHAWPKGVKFAKIVILSAEDKTEVHSHITTSLSTEIILPETCRGKVLLAKSAFLRHVDDTPLFGKDQVTFSMPLSAEDLHVVRDNQDHEEYEANIRAVEDHRRDVEEREREAQRRKKLDDEEKGIV